MSLKRKAADAAASDAKKTKVNSSITAFFSSQEAKPVDFDKAKWVEGLTPEQKDLLKLEIQTLHESWLAHLTDEITSPGFLKLKRFLKTEQANGTTIYPPSGDIYSWFEQHFSSRDT